MIKKRNLRGKVLSIAAVIVTLFFMGLPKAEAHCEVPCGIYNDSLRIVLIREHVTTIEKSMVMIEKLSKESTVSYNQIVRWTMNKEEHANKIQEIVSQYFLTQRIKPTVDSDKKAYKSYLKKVEALHQMLVYSMKCKQGLDHKNIESLLSALDKFESLYFHHHHH